MTDLKGAALRRLAMAVWIGLLALALAPGSAVAQEVFSGTFRGIDEARGLTLQLQRSGELVEGRIVANDGSGQSVKGRIQNDAVVGPLTYQGRKGTITLRPKPIGMAMIWQSEPPGAVQDKVFAFRRETLAMPSPPPGYQPPPPEDGTSHDAVVFLLGYEFWPAPEAARIYDGLESAHRSIIRLFPAVHTDVIWKLCRSSAASRELGVALRGAGVTCAMVDAGLKSAQASGAFNRYKRRVGEERQHAIRSIECARGIHTQAVCAEAARNTQRAASSMETVSTVLRGL